MLTEKSAAMRGLATFRMLPSRVEMNMAESVQVLQPSHQLRADDNFSQYLPGPHWLDRHTFKFSKRSPDDSNIISGVRFHFGFISSK
jgi:hypothetical protein